MEAREINATEWQAFGGCEGWSEQSAPVIRYLKNLFLIADVNGVEGITETARYGLSVFIPTQTFATQFLNSFDENVEFADLILVGFTLLESDKE